MLGIPKATPRRSGPPSHWEAYSTRSWTIEQHAYLQNLHEGPTEALDRFRTLFFRRESGPLSGNEEVVKMSKVLCKCFQEYPVENNELWRACADIDFIVFLVDIITGPDFFDHPPQFSSNMCGPLIDLLQTWFLDVRSGRKTRVVRVNMQDAIWESFESIWTSMWDRRSSLAQRCDSDAVWRRVVVALDIIARGIQDIREGLFPEDAQPTSVMIRTVYFSWIWSHGAASLTQDDIARQASAHYAPELLWDYFQSLAVTMEDDENSTARKLQAFMQELLDALDPNAIIRAAHNVLAYSPKLVDESLMYFLRVFALQMRTIGLQWYGAAPLLAALNTARARQSHVGSDDNMRHCVEINVAIYEHIKNMIVGLVAGNISSDVFPGHKFWDLLVGGLPSAYRADSLLRHEYDVCRCGDHAALAESLSTFLDQLSGLADMLITEIEKKHLPKPVIDDIRDAGISPRTQVTGIWFDVSVTLRRTTRHNPSWTTYTILLEIWLKLANALGIDEASQRDLEAAQRARQCWWSSCPYHLRPSEKPLLVCKGCKEARYCSAGCQRIDWKQGGHRTECRRVK